ncbi:helix-turn-helix domain-containing protein [Nocardia sp. CA-120079]|uniref:helix-turn-helix domain-containing protein n=1 Tax=Nocardia sp. CA-120079 TaxID=3239974 RepID=UPI003D95F322
MRHFCWPVWNHLPLIAAPPSPTPSPHCSCFLAEDPVDPPQPPALEAPPPASRRNRRAVPDHAQGVTDYAARLGYSTSALNRLAWRNTGLGAEELSDERIILEAKRLLTHAPGSVAEIAECLGFDDPSNADFRATVTTR